MKIYDDVGGEIKAIAETIVIMDSIPWALVGVASVIIPIVMELDGGAAFLIAMVGIVAAVFGVMRARMKAIELYAYGELVARTVSLEEKVTGEKKGKAKKAVEQSKNQQMHEKTSGRSTPRSEWVCQFCEHKNKMESTYCEACGCEYMDS